MMQNEIFNHEIAALKTLLRNAKFRYKLAIRDGAVSSVVEEVLEGIHTIEKQLLEKMANKPEVFTNSTPLIELTEERGIAIKGWG